MKCNKQTTLGFRSTWRLHLAVVGVATALLSTSYSTSSAQEVLTPLEKPVQVRMGVVGGFSDGPLYVAIERGYFSKMGLEPVFERFRSAGQMIPALGSNQIDIGGGSVAAALWNAQLRDLGVRAVADKGSIKPGNSWAAYVVANDSPIRNCSDLKGKNISNASNSNAFQTTIVKYLASCGLTLDDVSFKTLTYSDVPTAVRNGAIDMASLIEPWLSRNIHNGTARILFTEDEVRPDEQTAFILFSPGFIKNRAAAERFMVAYVQGVRDYQEAYANGAPPPDWLKRILVKHTGVQEDVLYEMMDPVAYNEGARLNKESMRMDYEWFKSAGLILSDDVKFDDIFDDSFVEFAARHRLPD